jgi:AbrB family looped-hinge helix DNA binding protein
MKDELTILSDGRVVIPSRHRKALGMRAGDELDIRLDAGRLILEKVEEPTSARLVSGKFGPALAASAHSPRMTPEVVKAFLANFP